MQQSYGICPKILNPPSGVTDAAPERLLLWAYPPKPRIRLPSLLSLSTFDEILYVKTNLR